MASGGNKRKFDEQESGLKIPQRRRRTAFTEEQLDRLEECFMEEKFPGITIREELARELNIKEDRVQVCFQNRRSRWRRRELQNRRQEPKDTAFAIPSFPSFAPFCRQSESTVTSWSFPESLSPSVAAALALKCKARDTANRSVIGQSSAPRGSVMATGFASATTMDWSQLSWVTSFPSTNRTTSHSMEEYIAAVTLANGFTRDN